jgi:hypothetical protein
MDDGIPRDRPWPTDGGGSGQTPEGYERRLVLRVLLYWRERCGALWAPPLAEIEPAAMPEMWPHCFVINVAGGGAGPVIESCGPAFAGYADEKLDGLALSALAGDGIVQGCIGYLPEVVARMVPISRGGAISGKDHTRFLYRSILLPLSDDGERLTRVLGAANGRQVASE